MIMTYYEAIELRDRIRREYEPRANVASRENNFIVFFASRGKFMGGKLDFKVIGSAQEWDDFRILHNIPYLDFQN